MTDELEIEIRLDAIADDRPDAAAELAKYLALHTTTDRLRALEIAVVCANAARDGRRVTSGGILFICRSMAPVATLEWFTAGSGDEREREWRCEVRGEFLPANGLPNRKPNRSLRSVKSRDNG